MNKRQLYTRHSPVPYKSYVIGFLLSIIATLTAYFFTVGNIVEGYTLVYVVLGIAIVQLIVQMVFFLHIGRGSRWKVMTFVFTILFVLIVVVGTVWVMHHLNYNMMDMAPHEMHQYMEHHEGI